MAPAAVGALAVGLVLLSAEAAAVPPFLDEQRTTVEPVEELAELDAVLAATGAADPVLLTGEVWPFAFRPTAAFLAWNPHISHPAARYHDRYDLVAALPAVQDPALLTYLLRRNRYDPVDVMLLDPEEAGASVTVVVDGFPLPVGARTFTIPAAALDPDWFAVTPVGARLAVRPLVTDPPLHAVEGCEGAVSAADCPVVAPFAEHL